ncbi:MAG: Multifunctional CCA protein [Candidatus Uhrbacteria bacterium GW2011_GWE2_46_68]|uniref:Multifunctional CCA protein n=2 Tax=Candidatus Uhriibacteriota TaxID=1752732 RepID=A0A0G1Q5D9_9BACT|nr:MAG: Multifunctional CCA protein [Candidatus Uhrbacteria bacterium GW2011_GWF2_46_218]KKU40139.1 MAG: Multifunctional CCA protein [Candidatus Uhrbacteria bacterium GW2011_GWE2_46_68]
MTQKSKDLPSCEPCMEKNASSIFEREPILSFCQAFLKEHPQAKLFLVGGAVRDLILKRKGKDYDFVICGVDPEKIQTWFSKRGSMGLVGRSFGVFKFSPKEFPAPHFEPIDLALPRREHAQEGSQGGYRDFDIQSDPSLSIEEDLSRRDFTMNALAYDVHKRELVDPFGGQEDLEHKIIRAVGDPKDRFGEDMSRTLRALRQAAQLGFTIEPNTWSALCETMTRIHATRTSRETGEEEFVVAREVIAKEILKALFSNPALATDLLFRSGAFAKLFPEIHQTIAQGEISEEWLQQTKDLPSLLALLFYKVPPKRVSKLLQDMKMESLDREVPYRIEIRSVVDLVERLQNVAELDSLSSWPAHRVFQYFANPQGERFLNLLEVMGQTEYVKRMRELLFSFCRSCGVEHLSQVRASVTGNDIIQTLGIKPGPKVGEFLRQAFDLQLTEGLDREKILERLQK